jgi:hypothetical protein
LKLELVAYTPNVETLIATAMLTTTSGVKPSTLFNLLRENPGKIKETIGRLETQHGSILEHNLINWIMEATDEEVLDILIENSFYKISRIGTRRWLVSANLRTVIETLKLRKDPFSEAFVHSLEEVAPTLIGCIGRGNL